MVQQDPRVTSEALEDIEDFFECVDSNRDEQVAEYIELEPSLIYSRNKNGNTALHVLIVRKESVELETLKVVLKAAADAGVVPDLTLANERGADVVRMLEAIEDAPLYYDFMAALDPYMAEYYEVTAAASREAVDTYLSRKEVTEARETIKKMEDGGGKPSGGDKSDGNGCTVMFVSADNNPDYSKILGIGNLPFNTMEDQKKMNRHLEQMGFNAKNDDLFNALDFDFSPKGFMPAMESSDALSLLVVPNILEDMSIEQIGTNLTKILGYVSSLFDLSADT